jgi:hypothetical protein
MKKVNREKATRGRPSAICEHHTSEQMELIEETTLLGEKTQQKTHGHGDETHLAQLRGRYFENLAKPALHEIGGGDIRQSFENQHESYQCYQ